MNKEGRAEHVQHRKVCIIISIIMPYSHSETAFILSVALLSEDPPRKYKSSHHFLPKHCSLTMYFACSLWQSQLTNICYENHQMKHILRVPGKNNKSGESASNTYHSAQTQSTVDGGHMYDPIRDSRRYLILQLWAL